MPRRRTIACDHCGHMLLKRDNECEVCGRITSRELILGIAKVVQIGVALIVFAFMYFKVKRLSPISALLTVPNRARRRGHLREPRRPRRMSGCAIRTSCRTASQTGEVDSPQFRR